MGEPTSSAPTSIPCNLADRPYGGYRLVWYLGGQCIILQLVAATATPVKITSHRPQVTAELRSSLAISRLHRSRAAERVDMP